MGVQRKNGLPMQVPMSANTLDPKEINLATKKADKGKGIVYIGNDQKTNEEIWLTDTQARTHMMFLGTTGSGKTEFLISVAFNALCSRLRPYLRRRQGRQLALRQAVLHGALHGA